MDEVEIAYDQQQVTLQAVIGVRDQGELDA